MTDSATATNEPFVGKELGSIDFSVTNSALNEYYNGLTLPRPSQGGNTIQVPSMLASVPDNAYFYGSYFSNHFGHLWMRQEWELFEPLSLGQKYEATACITDIYQRRDRTVVQYDMELRGDSKALVLRTRHHQSYLLDQSSGELQLRDPKTKQGARRFKVPDGDPFGPLERTITLDMCGTFFHGNSNYHTDREASRELGFRDVVVGGRMTMVYAAHLLEERFGAAWWTSGRLDVKFTNPVWPNDTVIARGVVIGPVKDELGRIAAFVWLTKPDETVVLVANASVAQPSL